MKDVELDNHKLWYHTDRIQSWKDHEYFPPVYLEINPTDTCNHRCWFCSTFNYLKKRMNTMERETYLRIVKDLGDSGIRSMLFQGDGEPLMNRATPQAIVEAKRHGIDTALVTNGSLLSKSVVDKILPCLSWMRVSSLEANPLLYNKTHGIFDTSFQTVKKNIQYACKRKDDLGLDVLIGVTYIPFDYNIGSGYDAALLCKSLGVDYFQVKAPEMWSENPEHQWRRNMLEVYKKQFDLMKTVETDSFRVNIRYDQFQAHASLFAKDFNHCYGLEFETYVDSDCCLYPCHKFWGQTKYNMGDLSKHSFRDVWDSRQKKDVLDSIYYGYDLDGCTVKCKQAPINSYLCRFRDPPLCINFP